MCDEEQESLLLIFGLKGNGFTEAHTVCVDVKNLCVRDGELLMFSNMCGVWFRMEKVQTLVTETWLVS